MLKSKFRSGGHSASIMSFKFGFEVDDEVDGVVEASPQVSALPKRPAGPSTEISLADLVRTERRVLTIARYSA